MGAAAARNTHPCRGFEFLTFRHLPSTSDCSSTVKSSSVSCTALAASETLPCVMQRWADGRARGSEHAHRLVSVAKSVPSIHCGVVYHLVTVTPSCSNLNPNRTPLHLTPATPSPRSLTPSKGIRTYHTRPDSRHKHFHRGYESKNPARLSA